jgi:hypothetical protein
MENIPPNAKSQNSLQKQGIEYALLKDLHCLLEVDNKNNDSKSITVDDFQLYKRKTRSIIELMMIKLEKSVNLQEELENELEGALQRVSE